MKKNQFIISIAISLILLTTFFTNCAEHAASSLGSASVPPEGADPIEASGRRQCVSQPIEVCTASNPCIGGEGEVFNSPSKIPNCSTDGTAKSFLAADGTVRYYCHYDASKADAIKRPLLLFFHGGSGEVENLYKSTDLRLKAQSYNLGKDSVSGFHLVGLQSKNLKLEIGRLSPGRHFDTFWWDFKSPSSNPEIRDIDQLINELVTRHAIDTQRIYLMGWSEGGMVATYYGMARHQTPSPFGHKVAAVAIYSSSSPFDRRITETDRCAMDLDFKTNLPIYTVSRTCDVVACNKAQEELLWAKGNFADTIDMESWVQDLRQDLGNPNVTHQLIDGKGALATTCQAAAQCSVTTGSINHITWPKTSENAYLDFLKKYEIQQESASVDLSFCHATLEVSSGYLCAIKPSLTGSNIKDIFASDTTQNKRFGFGYHVVGIPKNFSSQSKMHLHLTGSYGRPYNQDITTGNAFSNRLFLEEGLKAGRVMIQLAYNNRYQVNSDICMKSPTLDNCAGLVRTEIITGQDKTTAVVTSRADSIENRLLALMNYLTQKNVHLPFTTLDWKNIEVSGHSQGAGHSYMIAKFYGVKKACLLGGPYDVGDTVNPTDTDIADWFLKTDMKTSLSKIRSLVHTKDEYYEQFRLAYGVIGLVLNQNYFETSSTNMTDVDGVAITNGHSGIIHASQFSALRTQVCFND